MDNFEGHNKEQWSVSTGLKQKFGIVAFMNKNLVWRHALIGFSICLIVRVVISLNFLHFVSDNPTALDPPT